MTMSLHFVTYFLLDRDVTNHSTHNSIHDFVHKSIFSQLFFLYLYKMRLTHYIENEKVSFY